MLTILNPKRLQEVAQYEPNYLHLDRTESRDPEVAGRAGDLVGGSHHGLFHDAVQTVKRTFGKP